MTWSNCQGNSSCIQCEQGERVCPSVMPTVYVCPWARHSQHSLPLRLRHHRKLVNILESEYCLQRDSETGCRVSGGVIRVAPRTLPSPFKLNSSLADRQQQDADGKSIMLTCTTRPARWPEPAQLTLAPSSQLLIYALHDRRAEKINARPNTLPTPVTAAPANYLLTS